MKIETIRLLIIIFVAVPLLASMYVPAGQPRYRLKERLEAMKAYTLNPSTSTKTALDDEFALLHHHQSTMGGILLPALLLIDASVVYFFWNYGGQKHKSNTSNAENSIDIL